MVQFLSESCEYAHFELAIILVCNGNSLSIVALFDKVHLDVLTIEAPFEHLLMSRQAHALNLEMLIFFVNDGDAVLRVVGDHHIDDIMESVNGSTKGKILEKITIFVEVFETSDVSGVRKTRL